MTTNRLSKLTAMFCGWLYLPVASAHPGHDHSLGVAERLLHAVQTEWLAALVLLVPSLIVGYLYFKKVRKE